MFSRLVILAIHAIVFFAQVSFYAGVLASPLPLPWTMMAPDYGKMGAPNKTSASRLWAGDMRRTNSTSLFVPYHDSSISGRDSSAYRRHEDYLSELSRFHSAAKNNIQILHELVQQPSSDGLQGNCVSEIFSFSENLGDFQMALKKLGADKGLKNYDRSSELETLIKEMVDLVKDSFQFIYDYLRDVEIIAPVALELKCYGELLVDGLENLTDGLINSLNPSYRLDLSNLINLTLSALALPEL